MTTTHINLISTSQASDNGYRALADLAAAASGLDYRVIGGHMVQILIHVYPTSAAIIRGTSDADAGVGAPVAAGAELHERLIERGYTATRGNHYELGSGDKTISVDLLVPNSATGEVGLLGGRRFDVAPGLDLAMNSDPLQVRITAHLRDASALEFSVLLPSVECAVILKTLVRQDRRVSKDVTDLASLLEIAFEHRDHIAWNLNAKDRMRGLRLDTARELHDMVMKIERGTDLVRDSGVHAPRLAALIRALVRRP